MEKEIRTCPKCSAPLKPDSLYCKICGASVENEQTAKEMPNIDPIDKKENETLRQIPTPITEEAEPEEEPVTGVFAEGLPQWSLEPPQVVVRRKRAK